MQSDKSKNSTGSGNKSRKKSALGMGLGALIPDIESVDTTPNEFFMCDINIISPNRYQPRIHFSEDELKELSESISEQGVIQPVVLRKHETGYELIAGERRLRASKMAGLEHIPAVLKDITDTEMLEMSIVENIQRENFNPMEEAEAYQRLMEEFGFTQEQVAKRVGKSRPAVANFLRIRQLPEQIKASISENLISMGHARALLGAETAALQLRAWEEVISKELSVRETEALIKRLKTIKSTPETEPPSSEDIYISSLADKLSLQLGTKVSIKRKGKKGKVEIDFYNDEDLDRLLSVFTQN